MKDVIVDLSNVCRDATLGKQPDDPPLKKENGARWSRYLGVRDAWRAAFPDQPQVYAIADSSLRALIDQPAALKKAIDAGEVYVADGDADYAVLKEAQFHDAKVLTRDFFRDSRDSEIGEWVQGNTDSFFFWRGTLETGIRIVPRNMGIAGTSTIRKAHQKARNKAMGGQPMDPGVVWVCTNSDCVNAGEVIELPYQSASKEVYCSACGRIAKKQGGRQPPKPRPLPPTGVGESGPRQADNEAPKGDPVERGGDPWGTVFVSTGRPRPGGSSPPPPISPPPTANPERELSGPPESKLFLDLTFDDQRLNRTPLIEGRTTVLGRGRNNGVTNITDGVPKRLAQEVSSRHLAVTVLNGTVSVRDMSSYGTWLNGQRMEPEKDYVLQFGDRLAFCKDIIYGAIGRRDGENHGSASPPSLDVPESGPVEQKSGTDAEAPDLPSNLL